MFDIGFFKNAQAVKEKIVNGAFAGGDADALFAEFEKHRSPRPVIFNIETTNNCNMRCIMCPRTKLMKRKIENMDRGLFKDIVSQLKPFSKREIDDFHRFVQKTYGIDPNQPHENTFYFYVSAINLTLHGYGEPLLDPYLEERITECASRKIPTYFSCVPANIRLDLIERLMRAGAGVIKFSLDSLSDEEQRRIRGDRNNFTEAYKKIMEVIEMKQKHGFNTKIVVTLIDLAENQSAQKMKEAFNKLWAGQPVFAYIKSQDNRWFYEEDPKIKNRSHYQTQYCEYPWTSLSVMVDGSVVPCTQDYNVEMVLGDARNEPLQAIWNSEKYRLLRRRHITGKFPKGFKCYGRCDWKMVCDRIGSAPRTKSKV